MVSGGKIGISSFVVKGNSIGGGLIESHPLQYGAEESHTVQSSAVQCGTV